jgi:predicted secreted hydrolase
MKRLLLALSLTALVACAPARTLDRFVERQPDPIKDQGAHNVPVEWWYFNGHLETKSGPIAMASTIFKVQFPAEAKYGLIPIQSILEQFHFGHFVVIDKTSGKLDYAEHTTLRGATTGSSSSERMDNRLANWRSTREPDGSYTLLSSLNDGRVMDLKLVPERPEVVHGPGWSGNLQTGRSYYYSATRLKVSGTFGGEPVTGRVWFDHQWFSLQLEDGRDIMVYQLRGPDGKPVDAFISSTTGDGKAVESRKFQLSPWKFFKAPSGTTYPTAWFLKLEDGTALTIRATIENQEIPSQGSAGFPYYEGAVTVTGSVRGEGFMELTGYAPLPVNPFISR